MSVLNPESSCGNFVGKLKIVSGLLNDTVTVIFHKIKDVSLEAFVYDSSWKDVLGLYIHGYPYLWQIIFVYVWLDMIDSGFGSPAWKKVGSRMKILHV